LDELVVITYPTGTTFSSNFQWINTTGNDSGQRIIISSSADLTMTASTVGLPNNDELTADGIDNHVTSQSRTRGWRGNIDPVLSSVATTPDG